MRATALSAPRSLKAPVGCSFSHLSPTGTPATAPSAGRSTSAERTATPTTRPAAALRSASVTSTGGSFLGGGRCNLVTPGPLLRTAFILLDHPSHSHHRVAGLEVHDLDPLGVPADDPDSVHRDPDDDPVPGDHHQLVVRLELLERYDGTGLVGDLEGDDPLPAPFLHPVVAQLGALAVAVVAHHQQGGVAPHDDHADHLVTLLQLDPLHPGGGPAHFPHVPVVEPDAHPLTGGEHDVAVRVAHLYVDQLVPVLDVDGADPVGAHVAVGREQGLLHRALAGSEDETAVVGELPHRHQRRDLLALLDGDAVDHWLAPGRAPGLRDLVHLEPVELPLVGEEEQVVVGAGDEQVLHPVIGLEVGAVEPPPPATLPLVGGDRDPLDVARVGDGDDHVLFGDQVLDRELALVAQDLGSTVIAELFHHLGHLALEDAHPLGLAGQDALELLDHPSDLLELGLQLLDLEAGQLGQPHVEDGVALLLAQPEPLAQPGVGLGRVLRTADDLDHLVDVVDGDLEALEDVLPGFRRGQLELGPADDDVVPVLDVALEQLLQVHHLRHALVQGEHDHAEGGLHGGVLVELVQHHVGDGVALEIDDHPHAVLVRLVVHPADPVDLLVRRQLRDRLDQILLVDLIGDFGDHDLGPTGGLLLFDLGPSPHDHPPAAGLVRLLDPLPAVDVRPGGEIGPFHHLPEVGDGGLGVVDQELDGLGHLPQVVRRDI